MIRCKLDCIYNNDSVCNKNNIMINKDGKCSGFFSKNSKISRYKDICGIIEKDNTWASCVFIYPVSLYSEDNGFTFYVVGIKTEETEEEIIKLLYDSMMNSETTSYFDTNGCSERYECLSKLCEDNSLPYKEICELMSWM